MKLGQGCVMFILTILSGSTSVEGWYGSVWGAGQLIHLRIPGAYVSRNSPEQAAGECCSLRQNSPSRFPTRALPGLLCTASDGSVKQKNIAIHVTRSVETSLRKRHPWVFENEIRKQSHNGQAGDIAIIFDSDNNFLSAGLYDPHGPIRVRVLQHNQRKNIDADLIRTLVLASVAARDGIIPPDTDGYRAINGENDGLPGLVVDRYADTLVIKLYSACWLPWLPAVHAALDAAASLSLPHRRRVLLLSRQLQKLPDDTLRGARHGTVVAGPPLPAGGAVVFRENGLLFEADPVNGQKTGFFLDQRDNRMRVQGLCRAARVLNVFSYTGGFSLYAARGGAASVTSVDVSAPATAAAERNFALNRPLHPAVARAAHVPVAADAFECMRDMARRGERFDVVIVDPPSMANKAPQRQLALARYRELAELAVGLTAPGGRVVLASCSSRVSSDDFFEACHAGARSAHRPLRDVTSTAHAPDHPVRFAEGAYLKCLFATVP